MNIKHQRVEHYKVNIKLVKACLKQIGVFKRSWELMCNTLHTGVKTGLKKGKKHRKVLDCMIAKGAGKQVLVFVFQQSEQ